MQAGLEAQLKLRVREIPDFPKAGIVYRDITPLLADALLFARMIDALADRVDGHACDGLVAIESRGFIFGAALALRLSLPLQLVRKPGKLPFAVSGIDYALEYGSDRLEMHTDAIEPGKRYAIIDDVLATGGTAAAAGQLVQQLGGELCCGVFLIELVGLGGRRRLGSLPVEALLPY